MVTFWLCHFVWKLIFVQREIISFCTVMTMLHISLRRWRVYLEIDSNLGFKLRTGQTLCEYFNLWNWFKYNILCQNEMRSRGAQQEKQCSVWVCHQSDNIGNGFEFVKKNCISLSQLWGIRDKKNVSSLKKQQRKAFNNKSWKKCDLRAFPHASAFFKDVHK